MPRTRLQLRDRQALVLLKEAALQQLGVHACEGRGTEEHNRVNA